MDVAAGIPHIFTEQTGGRFGFAGAYTDRSGLSYMNVRYYNPATGTFLSRDPVQGVLGGSSISFNPYPYARNNPVNYVDPTGESPLLLVGLFLLGVGIEAGSQLLFEGEITHPWMLPVSGALNVAGYGFGKTAVRLSLSARTAFIGGAFFDVGLSAAADMRIRGDSFSTAFWGNVAGIGIGEVAGFAGRGAFRLGGRALRSTGSALQDAGSRYSRTFDLSAVTSGGFPVGRRVSRQALDNPRLRVEDIFFTQEFYSPNGVIRETGQKYTVARNAQFLRSNPDADLPPIRVFRKTSDMNAWGTIRNDILGYEGNPRNLLEGVIYTLDNRRLVTYMMAGRETIPIEWVTDPRFLRNQAWKFSTPTFGTEIYHQITGAVFRWKP